MPPLPLLLLLPERGRVVLLLLLVAEADDDCLDGEEVGCWGEGRGDWCGTAVAGVGAGAWALAFSSSSSAARPKEDANRLIICVGGVDKEESKASVCVCGGAGSLYVQPGRSDQSGHEPA